MIPQFSGLHKSFTTLATPVSVVVCVDGDDVPLHVRLITEPSRTERAAVRPFPCVGPCVYGEIPPCNEPRRAHLAPVGLHTIVRLHMSGVIRRLVKRGAALFTLVDFLSGVDPSMSPQVTDLCERLPTDVTHVRSLAKVHSMVVHQKALPSKRLAAVVTAVRPLPGVDPTMVCQEI